jgi:hypothetical protein
MFQEYYKLNARISGMIKVPNLAEVGLAWHLAGSLLQNCSQGLGLCFVRLNGLGER